MAFFSPCSLVCGILDCCWSCSGRFSFQTERRVDPGGGVWSQGARAIVSQLCGVFLEWGEEDGGGEALGLSIFWWLPEHAMTDLSASFLLVPGKGSGAQAL